MVSVRIPLTQDKFAHVSIQDAARVRSIPWAAWKTDKQWYARGMGGRLYLHRYILDAKPGDEIDHQDRNGLNCTRSNMRFSTSSQNKCNRGKMSNNTSGYKGVRWSKQKRKWQAVITYEKRTYHAGFFDNKKEAALAYDRRALEVHGQYAKTNESLGLLSQP
jgi:hypothetical protein